MKRTPESLSRSERGKPSPLPSIEIARKAKLLPIQKVAQKLGIGGDDLELYGKLKAKISQDLYHRLKDKPLGKLVLVTAITPTPAGEGKTTTSIGLCDALNRIGKRATVCLREPSVGPCFGVKGGGTGGGLAQVAPMEEINLHFTGDFHVTTSSHNLLAAMLDNHLYHGNQLGIDIQNIVWKRVLDMNDRSLRRVMIGLGGTGNMIQRESGFDITAASEIMATFCFSESLSELRERLGRIIVAYTRDGKPVTASDLKAQGPMTVLMRGSLKPNLVQTLENNPALIHGGPFGNIAHGCNSVVATKLAMRLSEYTITEAGFGADLGAEKFLNIKCRKAGLRPEAVVLVASIRALKYHGSTMKLAELSKPDFAALEKGMANLTKHIENIQKFGLPIIVAVNAFAADTEEEWRYVQEQCTRRNVPVARTDHFSRGGAGAENLARTVMQTIETSKNNFRFLYPDDMPLWKKIGVIAREIYGADGTHADAEVLAKLRSYEDAGYKHLPICMAKTQFSLSPDPHLRGRPQGFTVSVRDVKLSAGPGFVVAYTGEIMTMPGLPKSPAAERMDIDADGETIGLF
jgi:formate--tetrahydrofolate ligase